MKIAYTMSAGRGDTDLLLYSLAEILKSEGFHTCGVVQINSHCGEDRPCDMDVQVLPDGPMVRISQSLGPNARGCRLDPSALETAVAHVSERLHSGCDILIVNKFGKHEADGRGFRPVIAEALGLDIPVLVGLNRLNKDAFLKFSDGLAEQVPSTQDALRAWVSEAVSSRDTAA